MSFALKGGCRKALLRRFIRLNIVATSSYSSQLGFLIAHAYSSQRADPVWLDLVIVFIKSLPANPHCSTTLINSGLLKRQFTANAFLLCVRPVVSSLDRFAAYLLLLVAWVLTPVCSVRFWQPRIHWLDKPALKLGQFRVSVKLPGLPQILYGDGFLQYCMTDCPFWLRRTGVDLGSFSGSLRSVISAFYHFSLEPVPAQDVHSRRINRSFVFKRLAMLLDSLPASSPLSYFLQIFTSSVAGYGKQYLFFLPTTTFYETGRASLSAEIAMYRDYINELKLPPDALIICKPHPTSAPEKLSALAELSTRFSAVDWMRDRVGALSLVHFSLVPLELLLFMLISYKPIVRESSVGVAVASTASLSCLSLFPSMVWRAAFGDTLVHRYVHHDFSLKRLQQEALVCQYLADHGFLASGL